MKENRVKLKTYFETGDQPTQAEFAELIDSNLNLSGSNGITGSLTISGSTSDNIDGSPVMLHVMGDITASGNISSSGTIFADNFISDGDVITFGDNLFIDGHITASGRVSASGMLLGGGLNINGTTSFNDGDIQHVGKINVDQIRADSGLTTLMNFGSSTIQGVIGGTNIFELGTYGITLGTLSNMHVTASGNISSSGYIYADRYYTKTLFLQDFGTNANGHVLGEGGIKGITLNSRFINLGLPGSTNQNVTASGNLHAKGLISASAGIVTKNITIHQGGKIGDHESNLGTPGQDDYVFFDYTNRKIITRIDNTDGLVVGNGQVSINTSTPANNMELTVSGDISASGNVFADDITALDLISAGRLATTGNTTFGNTVSDTHIMIGGQITLAGAITASGIISGSSTVTALTVIGNNNALAQNNSGGAINETMTIADFPRGTVVGVTQTTSNNAVAYTLPAVEAGLEYTFIATATSTGAGTTTFSAPSAILKGMAICKDANEDISGTNFIFAATKFEIGTRVHIICDGTIYHITAICPCDVGDVSTT